jgi:TrmH family RNA methyltransferase
MAARITSLQNARVKNAAALRRRRGRKKQGRIIIDGVREVSRAVDSGVELVELFVCPEACGEDGRILAAGISRRAVDVLTVSPDVFQKLAFGSRAEGIVAVARRPHKSLESIQITEDALIAVLDGVEKPGNVGAVLRSADATGVSALVVADGGTDLYNPNVIRASLGAIFTLPVCAAGRDETLAWLRQHRMRIFATRVDGAIGYTEVSYCGRCAIVLGSEAEGLSDVWNGDDITAVSLPMLGTVDSLNVSTTAAVLFYEAVRQRGEAVKRTT